MHGSLISFSTATLIPWGSKYYTAKKIQCAVRVTPYPLCKHRTHTKFTHSSNKEDDDQSSPEEDGDEEQQQQEGMLLAGVAVLLIERVWDPALIALVEEVFPFSWHLLPGWLLFLLFLSVPSAHSDTAEATASKRSFVLWLLPLWSSGTPSNPRSLVLHLISSSFRFPMQSKARISLPKTTGNSSSAPSMKLQINLHWCRQVFLAWGFLNYYFASLKLLSISLSLTSWDEPCRETGLVNL